MRNRVRAVLGDGRGVPFPEGISDVALRRDGVLIFGTHNSAERVRPTLRAQGIEIAEIEVTDGAPFVDQATSVSQSFAIPWYAGQEIRSGTGIRCSSGYAFRVQYNGTWWYESTAGHCALGISDDEADWGSTHVNWHGRGYWYEPYWPGMGWTQLMNDGSFVCCPPLREYYDIALFSVNPLAQTSRPSPVSHVVTDYCPGGCHRNFTTATRTVTSRITNSGQLSQDVTLLTKSGARTGTSTGVYRGLDLFGMGLIGDLNNCGVFDGDSGVPVFRYTGSTTVEAIGITSSARRPANPADWPAAPGYCNLPDNKRFTSLTFAWVHVLEAATGAQVVTSGT